MGLRINAYLRLAKNREGTIGEVWVLWDSRLWSQGEYEFVRQRVRFIEDPTTLSLASRQKSNNKQRQHTTSRLSQVT